MLGRNVLWVVAIASLTGASVAIAEPPSRSAANPTTVPSNGVIAGNYPVGETTANFYFAADLHAGNLATQIAVQGGAKYKTLTLALLDGSGRRIDSYYITAGAGDNNEGTRIFPIDATGRYLLRLTT